jgi:hypothetical protein
VKWKNTTPGEELFLTSRHLLDTVEKPTMTSEDGSVPWLAGNLKHTILNFTPPPRNNLDRIRFKRKRRTISTL